MLEGVAVAATGIALLVVLFSLATTRATRREVETVFRHLIVSRRHFVSWPADRALAEPQPRGAATRGEDEAVARRRDAYLAHGPKAFYYLSEGEVRGLYSQIFRDVEPSEIVRTTSKEGEVGVGLAVGPLRPEAKRATSEGFTLRYEPEQNLSEMYNKLERELLRGNQVILCLEELMRTEIEARLKDFREACRDLHPDETDTARIEQTYIQRQKQALVDNKLAELRGAAGFVLMSGTFVVSASEAGYRLEYAHPVATDARIAVHCGAAGATDWGKQILVSSPTVKATVFGQVVGWSDVSSTLGVAPIALY